MNDLAKHIFDMGNAMNRAKAAELAEAPKGRWDMHPDELSRCVTCGNYPRACSCNIAPHIAKIPLRAEVRDMLVAADMYQEHADLLTNGAELHEKFAKQNREEAARLEQMSRDARAQSENLERMAGL